MGYDVSFHPISPEEMREWYFAPLTWIQQGQEEKVLALAVQHGMEDFYAEKYLNTLRVGAETESNELFDKGILRAAEYSEQSNGIRSMVNGLRSERCRLLREQDDDSILCGLRRLHAVFTELTEPVTAFDEMIFQEIVQQITVPSHTSICFHLIGGLNLTEKIPEQL